MATNFMVVLLPLPHVWALQLPLGRKVALGLALCLGIFVSAISMVRIVSLTHIDFGDATYTLPLPLMWSIVEEQVAIVCANLPLLRHTFGGILPARWFDTLRRQTSESSSRTRSPDDSKQGNGLSWMSHGVVSANFLFRGMVFERKPTPSWWSHEASQSDLELAEHGAPPDGIKVFTTLEWHREGFDIRR
ncbi:hypothetical protein BO71DRAFT_401470 [Aspergillus ellipticus CBS 707.79]|uniref:Rhodopsin domain-containing protein n=1 Tax=Aspergillus ellipticus CBS 707.79 TaxID=1448320 RepID=A0A319D2K2_9EURO|nr:hypothetical protein BO71DRAFT_401470 [Aspergillus ellipticus CBS 707.79]